MDTILRMKKPPLNEEKKEQVKTKSARKNTIRNGKGGDRPKKQIKTTPKSKPVAVQQDDVNIASNSKIPQLRESKTGVSKNQKKLGSKTTTPVQKTTTETKQKPKVIQSSAFPKADKRQSPKPVTVKTVNNSISNPQGKKVGGKITKTTNDSNGRSSANKEKRERDLIILRKKLGISTPAQRKTTKRKPQETKGKKNNMPSLLRRMNSHIFYIN